MLQSSFCTKLQEPQTYTSVLQEPQVLLVAIDYPGMDRHPFLCFCAKTFSWTG